MNQNNYIGKTLKLWPVFIGLYNISDQSQIGSSSSGKSYGEVDGVIVDNNQSRRIALFEAFKQNIIGE